MGNYIKKGLCVAPEVAPQLSITDRITDLLIDMEDAGRGPSLHQLNRLATLTAEAHRQAALGQITLVSRVSRIWDAAPAKATKAWYGRDENLFPLPAVTPRTYRLGGARVH